MTNMEQFKVGMQLTIAECRELIWNKGRNLELVWKNNINVSATAMPAESPQQFQNAICLIFSFPLSYTNSLLLFIFFPLLFPYSSFPCCFTAITRTHMRVILLSTEVLRAVISSHCLLFPLLPCKICFNDLS